MIGFGQTDDFIKLEKEVSDINYRMDKHHKQFFLGGTLNLMGIGGVAIGTILISNPIIYVGTALTFSGSIMMFNSHKWFKNIDITDFKKKDIENKVKKRTRQLNNLLSNGDISKSEYDKAINDLNNLKQ